MVWKDILKSSLQGVKKHVIEAEETTELRDVATREPKAVKIGDIEEPDEVRNAKETVDKETESRRTIIPGPGTCRGLGEGRATIPPGHGTLCGPGSSTPPDHNGVEEENAVGCSCCQ